MSWIEAGKSSHFSSAKNNSPPCIPHKKVISKISKRLMHFSDHKETHPQILNDTFVNYAFFLMAYSRPQRLRSGAEMASSVNLNFIHFPSPSAVLALH
ncbi:hypothetical protein AVEN_118561-1 [Araneus ventricosus]|uniref:Uncharacterized protein n=1 Tax=Araneus ventricosus TaxID=182803 RepID=A0A4Y2AWB1_ARAVE|nr:hypothetical protein AVEN_118561-1 [Araneus ventricosus]